MNHMMKAVSTVASKAARFLAVASLSIIGAAVVATTPHSTAWAAEKKIAGLEVLKPTAVGAARRVALGLNKSLVIELPRNVRDVLVANPEIADAIVRTSRKIFLIGNQVGQTNVFMFDKAGNTILSLDLKVERDILPLDDLIKKYVPGSNVVVEIANDNVILTGTVPNPLAARRAADLAQAFVTGGEATTGNFTQSATSTTTGTQNTSTAISNPDSTRAVSRVINLLKIEGEDQVHLKVLVAEVRRNVLKQLGINFSARDAIGVSAVNPNTFSLARQALFGALGAPQGRNGGVLASVTSNVSGNLFESTIEALERANVLRTLAEPTLTAQSGREASFLAGGEITVVTNSTVGDNNSIVVTTERRPLGVSLNFTPVVQSPERISLTLSTEVSSLDPTDSFATVGPVASQSIRVRRASSTIELPSGGTMILGGLIEDDLRQASSGIPFLRNMPILGSLFGSNSFTRNETELVIMVTPYLVRPTSKKNLTSPTKNFAPAGDAKRILFNQLNRIYGGKKAKLKGRYHGRVGFIYD